MYRTLIIGHEDLDTDGQQNRFKIRYRKIIVGVILRKETIRRHNTGRLKNEKLRRIDLTIQKDTAVNSIEKRRLLII